MVSEVVVVVVVNRVHLVNAKLSVFSWLMISEAGVNVEVLAISEVTVWLLETLEAKLLLAVTGNCQHNVRCS